MHHWFRASRYPSSGDHASEMAKMTNNDKYEIVLYWSQVDEAVIAEVPELPGCAADGETYLEALTNVEVVIREWIETAQELGRTVPVPQGRVLSAAP